jgi:HSP20 family protein
MPIIRWSPDPLSEFEQMLPGFFGRAQMPLVPAVDVYQTADEVIVEVPLPGIDPKQVEVSIEDDVLTISGEQRHSTEVDEKSYHRREVRYGRFHRAVTLPAAVEGGQAKATYEKGVLKVSVPIQERAKPTRVAVNVKE